MATVEDFIHNRLTTDASIAAIVGTRVYRVKMPDNPTLPAITFQMLSGDVVETFDGDSGMSLPVMGIDCWAPSAGAVKALALLVKTALLGYSGTYSDVIIARILEWSEVDLYDVETEIYHVACSVRIWYR